MVKHISKIAYGSDVYYVKDTEARSALIDKTEKGAVNGVAELDSTGKVPSSQLPDYTDFVLEYENKSSFPSTGEAGKIYIDKATNLLWRWNGTTYAEISPSAVLSVGGQTGTVTAALIGTALTNAGYKLTDEDTTYTFAGGTNKITVTPSGGTAQDITVTPSISKNVTGAAAWTAADIITTTNAASGNVIKASGKSLTTTTPSASSDDTTIPTSKAVWSAVSNGIATADAMVYKGTIAGGSTGAYGALTVAANKGDTYKVTTAGKVDGVAVEVGDMIICNTDSTAAATSSNYSTIAAKWDFILANIDGAVTGPASSTDGNLAAFNGTTGKVIKDSSLTTTNVSDAVSKKHSHSTLTLSTSAQTYDGSHTLQLPATDPYTSARTPSSHSHGNITNAGALLTTDITIGSGDKLVVTDSSNSSKIARTSVSFDGSTTTKALTPKGTFETFLQTHQDISGKQDKVAKLGSTSKPLYTSAAGTFAQCSTYAGGTAVTLNGTSKAASTASFYAPTAAGTAGQVLLSSGGAPNWKTGDIIHYITSPSGTAGTKDTNRTQWTGTADGVTALYTGLMVMIKVPLAGVNKGVTLNINSLGEHPVVLNANSIVTTHYPVGTIMPLIYDADQKATVMVSGTNTEYTGCWKIANYDANTTYSAGTTALLNTGTDTANRVWPAKQIADYVTGLGYITSSGSAANVTGTVAIANGGTGATTRLNALKALTNENVGSAATYFLTITNSWGKGGYTSVADAKTVLAMTGATADAAGTAGVVPAPAKGKLTSFLCGNGTWAVPTNTTYSAGTGLSLSGTTFSLNLTKALVTDALGYTPPTTNTWTAMTGATASANGTTGYVSATPPKDGYNTKFLRADNTWAVPTDTNTDTKVTTTVTEPTSAKTWYPIFTTSASTVTGTTVSNPTGFWIKVLQGTAAAGETAAVDGYSYLYLGNSTATGTAGNKTGGILLYNNKGKYFGLYGHVDATSNRTLYLPNAGGTLVAHTTNTAIGSTTNPVYISAAGVATAIGHTIAADVPSGAVFTDNKVTQTSTTTNADYEVLLSSTADNTTRTEGARKTSTLTYNPSTTNLSIYPDEGIPRITLRTELGAGAVIDWKVGATDYFQQRSQLYNNVLYHEFWSTDNGGMLQLSNGYGVTVMGDSTGFYKDTAYEFRVCGKSIGESWDNTSDVRLKNITSNVDFDVEDIANAPLFKFTWIDPNMGDGVNVGTSAQYWETVVPELITKSSDDMNTLSMQYGVTGLASAIVLARKVVKQEETIKSQEQRIKALEDVIAEIKNLLNN